MEENSKVSNHRVDRRTTLKKLGIAGFGGLAALGSAGQATASRFEGDERVAAQALRRRTGDLPGDDFLWTDTHMVDSGGREYYSTVLGYRGSVLTERDVDVGEVERWAHEFSEGGLGVAGDPSGNKMYTIKGQELQVNPDWGHIEINEDSSAGSAAFPYNGWGNFSAASRTLVQKLQNALIPVLDPVRSAKDVVEAYHEKQFDTVTQSSIDLSANYVVFTRHEVSHQALFTIDTIPGEQGWLTIESGMQTTVMSQMGYEYIIQLVNSTARNWSYIFSQSQGGVNGSLFSKLDQMTGEELKSMNIARVSKQEIRDPVLKQTVESSNDDRDHAYVANFPMEIKGEKKITEGSQRRTAHRR